MWNTNTIWVLSVSLLLPVVTATNFTFVGAGYCQDPSSRYYSYTRYSTGDVPDLTSCENVCIAENATVGTPAFGFYFETTSSPLYTCRCLYAASDLSGLTTTDFPSPHPQSVSTSNPGNGPVTSSDGSADIVCYARSFGCDVRLLIALDRTFANKVVDTVDLGSSIATKVVDALEFGSKAAVGLLNLQAHSVKWGVPFSSSVSKHKTSLLTTLQGATGGWKNRATNFWEIFEGEADVVADNDISSYILIISDGNLLFHQNWKRLGERKAAMQSRLGSKMPKIICYRVRTGYWSTFFNEVCDENFLFHQGMDGKSDGDIAQSIVDAMCIST